MQYITKTIQIKDQNRPLFIMINLHEHSFDYERGANAAKAQTGYIIITTTQQPYTLQIDVHT